MSNKQESATKPESKSKIYSQASNDFVVPTYEKRENAKTQAPHTIESAIIVKGGANVAYSASNKTQRNTDWAITEVTAKELETLKAHQGFMRRVKRGFITFEEPTELKADSSAQMTEKQMKAKAPAATAKTGPADE